MSTQAAPGWYVDPTDPQRWRFWDGQRWQGTAAEHARVEQRDYGQDRDEDLLPGFGGSERHQPSGVAALLDPPGRAAVNPPTTAEAGDQAAVPGARRAGAVSPRRAALPRAVLVLAAVVVVALLLLL